jgi:hypothetical protein
MDKKSPKTTTGTIEKSLDEAKKGQTKSFATVEDLMKDLL